LPYAIIYIITNAIGVCIGCAGATALTNSVIDIAIAVTVAGGYVGAPAGINFSGTIANSAGIIGSDARVIFVTYLIRISVVQAIAVAVQPLCRVSATCVGIGWAWWPKFRDKKLCVRPIGFTIGAGSEVWKILTGYLNTNITICGELGDQYLSICIRNALVITVIVDVPEPADEIVHDQVITCFKIGDPVLVWACNRADRSLWSAVFWGMTDGDPAVINKVGEETQ
jgi:hypothetical protein